MLTLNHMFVCRSITAFHMYPDSKYLFVGTEEGSVRVIDIEALNLSTYKITSKAVRSGAISTFCDNCLLGSDARSAPDVSAKNRSPVRWLGVAPDSEGSIMIAYADGLIVLWGLKQKKVLRHYELFTQPLESCAWHPEGKFFITGYEVRHRKPLLFSIIGLNHGMKKKKHTRMASCVFGNKKRRSPLSDSMVLSYPSAVTLVQSSRDCSQFPVPRRRGRRSDKLCGPNVRGMLV